MKRHVLLVARRPWDWSSATPEVRQSYFDAHDAVIAAASLLPPAYTVEIRPVTRIEGYDPQ